jgi:prepilin peptidase CpaA
MLSTATNHTSTLLLLLLLALAMFVDTRQHRIPNAISLGGIVLGIGMQTGYFGWPGLLDGLAGMSIGLFLFLPFHLGGGMGAGDVKLMAAIGTFLGPFDIIVAALLSLLTGAIIAVSVLVLRGGIRDMVRRFWHSLLCLLTTGKWVYIPPENNETAASRFPYAVAIAIGTVGTLWWLSTLSDLVLMLRGI